MGLPQKAVAYIEPDEYLALENASRYRHEYLAGVIYAVQGTTVRAMAGGSAAHADLIRNVGFALHTRLSGTPCSVKMADMRLHIAAAEAYFYPDVVVHCSAEALGPAATELTDARLVCEVLSPTTWAFDFGDKLKAYQSIAGLQHIVLVASTQQAAWACERGPDGAWTAASPWQRGSTLSLGGLGVELPWAEVYDGVGL
jgi:Uma2 family endonuclease